MTMARMQAPQHMSELATDPARLRLRETLPLRRSLAHATSDHGVRVVESLMTPRGESLRSPRSSARSPEILPGRTLSAFSNQKPVTHQATCTLGSFTDRSTRQQRGPLQSRSIQTSPCSMSPRMESRSHCSIGGSLQLPVRLGGSLQVPVHLGSRSTSIGKHSPRVVSGSACSPGSGTKSSTFNDARFGSLSLPNGLSVRAASRPSPRSPEQIKGNDRISAWGASPRKDVLSVIDVSGKLPSPRQSSKSQKSGSQQYMRFKARHHAACRIQRAWRISRWRRMFIAFSEQEVGWVGTLTWLQQNNQLYGTELADSEDVRWWYLQKNDAPLDRDVDPWGCAKLHEHLNTVWYGRPPDDISLEESEVPQVLPTQHARILELQNGQNGRTANLAHERKLDSIQTQVQAALGQGVKARSRIFENALGVSMVGSPKMVNANIPAHVPSMPRMRSSLAATGSHLQPVSTRSSSKPTVSGVQKVESALRTSMAGNTINATLPAPLASPRQAMHRLVVESDTSSRVYQSPILANRLSLHQPSSLQAQYTPRTVSRHLLVF